MSPVTMPASTRSMRRRNGLRSHPSIRDRRTGCFIQAPPLGPWFLVLDQDPVAGKFVPSGGGMTMPVRSPLPRSGGQPEVLLVRGDAGVQRVGPADLLKLERYLGVIPVRSVTAVAADDLERAV